MNNNYLVGSSLLEPPLKYINTKWMCHLRTCYISRAVNNMHTKVYNEAASSSPGQNLNCPGG